MSRPLPAPSREQHDQLDGNPLQDQRRGEAAHGLDHEDDRRVPADRPGAGGSAFGGRRRCTRRVIGRGAMAGTGTRSPAGDTDEARSRPGRGEACRTWGAGPRAGRRPAVQAQPRMAMQITQYSPRPPAQGRRLRADRPAGVGGLRFRHARTRAADGPPLGSLHRPRSGSVRARPGRPGEHPLGLHPMATPSIARGRGAVASSPLPDLDVPIRVVPSARGGCVPGSGGVSAATESSPVTVS